MTMTTERWPGRIALMVAHCAGMIDLVALPVWIGTLISRYRLDPQQAGGLATLFLLGAVASSLFFAPRLHMLNARGAAVAGFGISGLAFIGVTMSTSYAAMAVLHVVAGIAAACGLSFTHGAIARSARPHRLFAIVGTALGVFAVVFLGGVPKLVEAMGGPALFWVFGGLMLVSTVVAAIAFPEVPMMVRTESTPVSKLSGAVVAGALGISFMSLTQSMMFSFLERIGADRGFGAPAVSGVLIALGIVNLFPAPLAALLERRWHPRTVLLVGPILQMCLALLMTQGANFAPYATGAVFFAGVMIFTHTFAFGLLAALDPSGRVLAATPAMIMTGSAIGPILGGTLVKIYGYSALGLATVVIGCVAVFCFSRARGNEDA